MPSKLNRVALANTLGTIDLVLHSLFHLWVSLSPDSYEYLMNLFVAGLHLEVTEFDSDIQHILVGSAVEALAFWLLGFVAATLYNAFARRTGGDS